MARPTDLVEMVRLPAGRFIMGSDTAYPEEAPAREVEVGTFAIDRFLVTNGAFQMFIDDTGYVTLAERAPLVPGALVFHKTARPVDLRDHRLWWSYVPGASWRAPEGPGTSLRGREDHPVVHVAFEDARAYAVWRDADLPSEREWEYAARGGLERAVYAWGDEVAPGGRAMANFWQGEFPWQDLALDGHSGTSPVGSFPPNGYGICDMTGNVWEWTTDDYQAARDSVGAVPCCAPPVDAALTKVTKGGSYLCAANYCLRYRPSARSPQGADSATCHLGFRCVVRGAA